MKQSNNTIYAHVTCCYIGCYIMFHGKGKMKCMKEKKEKDTHAEIVCAGFGHQKYIEGRCQPVMQTWHSGELISRENPHA